MKELEEKKDNRRKINKDGKTRKTNITDRKEEEKGQNIMNIQ